MGSLTLSLVCVLARNSDHGSREDPRKRMIASCQARWTNNSACGRLAVYALALARRGPQTLASMIQQGILNPDVLELLARIRHTNRVVIADWAFPFWPEIETVDISLTRDIPTIQDVLKLLQPNFKVGHIFQAEEFLSTNPQEVIDSFDQSFAGFTTARVERLAHLDFKKLVPDCIGLIRTGDTTAYGNVVLESV